MFSDQKEDVRTPFHRSLLAPLYSSSPVAAMYKTSRIHRKWIGFYRNMEEGKKRYIQYNGHNNDIEKKRFSSFLLFWTARNCRIFFSKRAFAIDFAVAATNTAFYILPCCRFIPRSKEEESGTRAT